MLLLDSRNHCLAANRALCSMLDCVEPDLLDQGYLDLIHPDDRADALHRFQRLFAGEGVQSTTERRYVTRTGRILSGLSSASVVLDTDDKPLWLIVQVQDVSEYKRLVEELRHSEQLLRAVVEDQMELVCRFKPDMALTFINEAYCRHLGRSPEELIGQNYLSLLPEGERKDTREHIDSLIERPRLETFELRAVAADGRQRWQEWTDRAICDEAGRVLELQRVGRDITERRLAEEAEREQRALAEGLRDVAAALSSTLNYEQVLDRLLSSVGRVVPHDAANIMLIDPKSDEAYVARSRGYAEHGQGEWISQLRFPISLMPELRQMIEKGQPLVVPDVRNDPQWVLFPESSWLRSYAGTPIRVKGQTVGFFNFDSATLGFFTEAHIERLQAFADQAAVAIQNARLFEATRHSVERLTLLHQAGVDLAKAESVEELYREVLRWARGLLSATASALTFFDGLAHLVLVAVDGMDESVLGTRIGIGEGVNGKAARTRRPFQVQHYCEWTGHLPVFTNQNVDSAVALPLIWQDRLVGTLSVTDLATREFSEEDIHVLDLFASFVAAAVEQRRAMSEAQAREIEANTLSTRLANAQEEERTRIAEQLHDAIGYRLVTLQKNTEQVLSALGPEHSQAGRLADNLNVLQETHQQARWLAMDLSSKVLDDLGISPAAKQYIDRLATSTGMYIHLHVTGHVRRLSTDIERVAYRSLQEAVVNSLRHAGATDIAVQIHFGGKSLRLTVQDDGRGFDVHNVQTSNKGTALGLPELRRQVEALQGEFILESSPGQGTLIALTLPFRMAVASEKSRTRVLLVDDHEMSRQGLRMMLAQSAEFTCIGEAADGLQAVRQVELNHPDLVVMDVKLPKLNGIDAARQIARRFPHVRIVMLTYYSDEAYLQQSFQVGAQGYLLKSDEGREIMAGLQAVCEGERALSASLTEVWARLQVEPPASDPLEALTTREREVFGLIVAGNTNRKVGESLGISVRTVEVYRKNIMGKLGVKNLAQLVQFAHEKLRE